MHWSQWQWVDKALFIGGVGIAYFLVAYPADAGLGGDIALESSIICP